MSLQIAEDAFRELHSGEADRHRPGADFGLRANAFPDFKRPLKSAVQDRPRRAMVERLAVSGAELTENLRLPEHHRVKSGGHAEQVPHGIGPDAAINSSGQFRTGDLVERSDEILHGLCDGDADFGWNSIELAAIAGGNDDGFVENSLAAELVGGIERLLRGKGNSLAELHGRRAVAATDERNLNSACASASGTGSSGHQKK